MRSFIRFFSSVRLAIALIILITLASILGTFIPQGRSAAEYTARYGGLAAPLAAFQLTRLYQSGWYLTLLLLFAVNIMVCTYTRLGPKWRRAVRPVPDTTVKAVSSMRINSRFRLPLALAASQDRIAGLLRARHYRLASSADEGRAVILARKKALGWFGSDVVHVGLLVILAGGLTSGLGGRRTDLALLEGQTADVPGSGFQVRLDKFETEYYPQGGVKDWKSTVTVIENGAPALTRIIEVNHPLTYRGVSFYQSSYGWDWENPRLGLEIRKRGDASFSKAVSLKVGERTAIEDPDVTGVIVQRFVPDFVVGERNEIQTRSLEPNNPAAQVEAWKGEEQVFSGWVFAKFPDFGQGHGSAAAPAPVVIVLKDYSAAQYSVLEAARDPGANLIWLGCLLVTAGFFLAFYWHPREIRIVLEEAQGKVEVTAGGTSAKGREAFQNEFNQIVEQARRLP